MDSQIIFMFITLGVSIILALLGMNIIFKFGINKNKDVYSNFMASINALEVSQRIKNIEFLLKIIKFIFFAFFYSFIQYLISIFFSPIFIQYEPVKSNLQIKIELISFLVLTSVMFTAYFSLLKNKFK